MSDVGAASGNTWAQFIRDARAARGWSIDELARRAEVSRMTIIRWEGGARRFKPETIERVAAALEVPHDAALRAAFGDAEGSVGLPPPLPREIARMIDAYWALDPAGRQAFLERLGWLAEWAEMRIQLADPRVRHGLPPAG